jgi:DNA repair exonuclease SbcCD ATPase subunit
VIEFDNFTQQAHAKWYIGMMSNARFDFLYGGRMSGYTNMICFSIEASSGNIKAKGNCSAVTFVSTSDVRLKEDIQPLKNRGKLKPVKYKLKENGTEHIGFLAQDIQKLYPEVVPVSNDENEFLGINYGNLTAVLSVQINELIDEVDKLKLINKELNDKINNRVEELNIKNKELNDKNKELNTIINDKFNELNKENKELKNTVSNLKLENKELLKNITEFHGKNTEDFNKKFNELYSKFSDKTNDLINQNNELKKEIEKLKDNKENELKELNKKKKDILKKKVRRK